MYKTCLVSVVQGPLGGRFFAKFFSDEIQYTSVTYSVFGIALPADAQLLGFMLLDLPVILAYVSSSRLQTAIQCNLLYTVHTYCITLCYIERKKFVCAVSRLLISNPNML